MRFPKRIGSLALTVALCATAGASHAQSGSGSGDRDSSSPSSEVDVQRAAAEYEAGRRAYQEKRYADAAFHFESAYTAAPRAEALRNAIRTRNLARELDRAATLAVIAEKSYGKDAPTMVLVRDVLGEANTKLGRVDVTCNPACTIKVDGNTPVLGDQPREEHHVYVKPGSRSLEARWPGKGVQVTSIDVPVGGREEWKTEPAPEENAKTTDKPGDKTTTKELPGPAPGSEKPLPKGVFYTGVALSVLGAGVTVAFYIDQKRVEKEELAAYNICNPDVEGDCPDGHVSKGARRKTLIVGLSTGAVVLGTAVVGLFFTRWTSSDPATPRASNSKIQPMVMPLKEGAAFGLTGHF